MLISGLEKTLKGLKEIRDNLVKEIDKIDTNLDDLSGKIDDLTNESADKKGTLIELNKAIEGLEVLTYGKKKKEETESEEAI